MTEDAQKVPVNATFAAQIREDEKRDIGQAVHEIDLIKEEVGVFNGSVVSNGKIWMMGYTPDADKTKKCIIVEVNKKDWKTKIHYFEWPEKIVGNIDDSDDRISYGWRCVGLLDCGEEYPRPLLNFSRNEKVYIDEECTTYNISRTSLEWNLGYLTAENMIMTGLKLDVDTLKKESLSAELVNKDILWCMVVGEGEQQAKRIEGYCLKCGKIKHRIEMPVDYMLQSVTTAGDSRLLMIGQKIKEDTQEIRPDQMLYLCDLGDIDKTFESGFEIPRGENFFSPVLWPYNTRIEGIWLAGDTGIFTWDIETNVLQKRYELPYEGKKTLRWMNKVNGLTEEEFICVSKKVGEPLAICSMSTAINISMNDHSTITVANSGSAVVTEGADNFNAAQDVIFVDVLDYSDSAAAAAGFASGTEMLQRALVQGEQIDIIVVPNNFSGGLLDPALFLDLYPLIDADSELSRDDFISGVLTACENGDTLPTIVPQYNLLTAVGSAAKLGDTPGWDWAQYDALTAGVPTPLYGFDRATVLHYMVQMGGKSLLDYDAAAAHLDTPRFAQLLTRAKAYPESAAAYNAQDPKPQFTAGGSLAMIRFVTDFSHIRTDVYNFDGPIVYKGFPTDDGGTGSAFTAGLRLGITANCADADAAWQFVRQFLLPAYQDELQTGFPLRRDSLQKRAAAAQQPLDYPGLPLYFAADSLTEKQQEYWMRAITAEEAQQLVDLIEATGTLFRYDAAVLDIIGEESSAFFAGQTTAEAAAAIMQNRVQTYLDEQG